MPLSFPVPPIKFTAYELALEGALERVDLLYTHAWFIADRTPHRKA